MRLSLSNEASVQSPVQSLARADLIPRGGDDQREDPHATDDQIYLEATEVRKLGRGSSGDVYLLRLRSGPQTGMLIVSKRCPIDDEMSDEQKHEMYHEVRILSSLLHPHIVGYLHAATSSGVSSFGTGSELAIFMEYCEGGTLSQVIRQQKGAPFQTLRVVMWTAQLCSALEYLHEQCVLHRDLKSANVFLTADAMIKLGDFGLSRSLSTFTHFAQTVVGTPHYMAPEVLSSSPYAHAADVWSVGIILFELLTLKRPFDGPHIGSIVARITGGLIDADAAEALRSCGHPAALTRLLSREALFHPDPDERLRLEDLMSALQPMLQQPVTLEPILLQPSTPHSARSSK